MSKPSSISSPACPPSDDDDPRARPPHARGRDRRGSDRQGRDRPHRAVRCQQPVRDGRGLRSHHGYGVRRPRSGPTGKRRHRQPRPGAPIVRTIRDEFVFGTRVPESRPTAPLSYEAATLDQSRARLTARARESESATEIEATGWAYGDSRNLKLLPEGTRFKPGFIYDFRYPARDPKVLGIGYAATRDL